MRILNHTQNSLIADNIRVANTFLTRLVGLLNRKEILPGEALIIENCQQIHMFFMKFPIDVIFVDRNNIVVGLMEDIKPFAMSPIFMQSRRAIELPSGAIAMSRTSLGDIIQFPDS